MGGCKALNSPLFGRSLGRLLQFLRLHAILVLDFLGVVVRDLGTRKLQIPARSDPTDLRTNDQHVWGPGRLHLAGAALPAPGITITEDPRLLTHNPAYLEPSPCSPRPLLVELLRLPHIWGGLAAELSCTGQELGAAIAPVLWPRLLGVRACLSTTLYVVVPFVLLGL